jgi:hypothetical protein
MPKETAPTSGETPPEFGKWLEAQPEDVKVLGSAGHEAYKAGAVKLDDFVGQRCSKDWGTTRQAKSLGAIVGSDEAKRWRESATVATAARQGNVAVMIKRLAASQIEPNSEQVGQIMTHIAQSGFASRPVNTHKAIVGQVFQGRTLSAREPSLTAHLAKRVLVDEQWAANTTPDEYMADLQQAIAHRDAKMCLFVGRDKRRVAAILSPNDLPEKHLGARTEPLVFVLYSADHGIIVSGYQISGIETIDLPKDVKWIGCP